MAPWLNKQLVAALLCSVALTLAAQDRASGTTEDYKDRASHEKFRKRRNTVAAWQINQLKQGALVVRLSTNQMVIDGLKKQGLTDQAEGARLEQAAVNLNVIRAFKTRYTFSKVYFIYSNSSDTLRQGARSNIFIDSSLRINPAITMNEKFYLIAESDYIFNSSIGFVPEDSANHVVERGNPSSVEFPIVVKNKFGHQLKSPFPYSSSKTVYVKTGPVVEMLLEGQRVKFTVQTGSQRWRTSGDLASTHMVNGKSMELSIPRASTYMAMSQIVEDFNAELNRFYRSAVVPGENDMDYFDAKPFLY